MAWCVGVCVGVWVCVCACVCVCVYVGILQKNPWTTAALHLDSTCRESLEAVASLFIVARLTLTSAAFPLAEQIVYAW